jgi:hypothetical protein
MAGRLREDIYSGGPSVRSPLRAGRPSVACIAHAPCPAGQNELLRYWLSQNISRECAERSLCEPAMAPVGSYILRRSESAPGNYALTVVEGRLVKSYKIVDLVHKGRRGCAVGGGCGFARGGLTDSPARRLGCRAAGRSAGLAARRLRVWSICSSFTLTSPSRTTRPAACPSPSCADGFRRGDACSDSPRSISRAYAS